MALIITTEQAAARTVQTAPAPVAPVESALKIAARAELDRGSAIFLLQPRKKEPTPGSNGFKDATKDASILENWDKADYNIGIGLGESDLTVLDFDTPDSVPEWVQSTRTLKVKTARGLHVYFRGARQTKKLYIDGKIVGDLKSTGGYVLAAGSHHPDGPVYTVVDDSPIIDTPERVSELLKGGDKAPLTASVDGPPIPFGSHDTELTRIAGKLREAGLGEDAIREHITDICIKRCENYGTDFREMTAKIAHSVCKYEVGKDVSVYFEGIKGGTTVIQPAPSTKKAKPESKRTQTVYLMSEEEIELERDKEFPRIPLAPQAGPTWDDSIMYGQVGELAKAMGEYNEGHMAGIYMGLLVTLGSVFGPAPRFRISATYHHTNEFVANVGPSSIGRKGGARDEVNRFAKLLDPEWASNRIVIGLGSGENIINLVRDDAETRVPVKDKGGRITGYEKVVKPGIPDKRLMIREAEMSTLFKIASKPDALAGVIVRNSWDSSALGNSVKGVDKFGMSNSTRCEEPHISITGDITTQELISTLPNGSENNGFGNRFLYCYVFRTKECAEGGPEVDYAPFFNHFVSVIEHARQVGIVPLSKRAKKVWAHMYGAFDADESDNLATKMTSRGPAHVRRLALIIAICDLSDTVESEHLHAAKALWDYCEESARYIFTGTTMEQSKLLGWIKSTGKATAAQVREDFYKRNRKAEWIKMQLTDLVRQGKLTLDGEVYS